MYRFILSIILVSILSNSLYASSLDNKKAVPVSYNNSSAFVLENTLWIRIKKNVNLNDNKLVADLQSLGSITPLLEKKYSYTYSSNKINQLLSSAQNSKIIQTEDLVLRTYILEYNAKLNPLKMAEKVKLFDWIEKAEPYYINMPLGKPDDPYINSQSMLSTIHAFEAWDIEQGDESVVIAVCDNGVNQENPDLASHLALNDGEIQGDGIDNDNNGYIDDYSGYNFSYLSEGSPADKTYNFDQHGTEVAGIAAANTNNGFGIAGVGYKCKLFPIKIAPLNSSSLIYGYQAITYAAIRGFKVLNCSWGSVKPFSDVEQSIIDYAVSRDVLIIAASGNTGSGADRYSIWYPAAYKGVLGVGEVDQNDIVTANNTVFGIQADIMAPGIGNFATSNNSIVQVSYGTSYSSPVVAGAAAIVRSKHKNLNADKVIDYLRVTSDDISSINTLETKLIPGRVNMFKAVSSDPGVTPALKLLKTQYYNSKGILSNRFDIGDTVEAVFSFINILADAGTLDFNIEAVYNNNQSVDVIPNIITKSSVSGEIFEIKGLKFIIKNSIVNNIIFRVNASNNSQYKDFFKFSFTNGILLAVFENEKIKFSVGDAGEFGYTGDNETKKGIGFLLKDNFNALYAGGVYAAADEIKAVSTNFGNPTNDYNDFKTIKPLLAPEPNKGIIQDDMAKLSNKIGYQITHEYSFVAEDIAAASIKYTLTNNSGKSIYKPAIGLFLDTDIGSTPEKNQTKLFPEAIPESMKGANIACQMSRSTIENKYFAALVVSFDTMAVAQATGLSYEYVYDNGGFGVSKMLATLEGGTSLQFNNENDVAMTVGMMYPEDLNYGDKRVCYVCLAASENETELASLIKTCALSLKPSPAENMPDTKNRAYFNSKSERIDIRSNNILNSVLIIDVCGRVVGEYNSLNQYELSLPANLLNEGVYFIRAFSTNNIFTEKVMISR